MANMYNMLEFVFNYFHITDCNLVLCYPLDTHIKTIFNTRDFNKNVALSIREHRSGLGHAKEWYISKIRKNIWGTLGRRCEKKESILMMPGISWNCQKFSSKLVSKRKYCRDVEKSCPEIFTLHAPSARKFKTLEFLGCWAVSVSFFLSAAVNSKDVRKEYISHIW